MTAVPRAAPRALSLRQTSIPVTFGSIQSSTTTSGASSSTISSASSPSEAVRTSNPSAARL